MNVKNNLEKINNDIKNICQKSGRNFEDITLIAVTKYVGDERVKEAQVAGVHDFAENRAVNYIERKEKFPEATWHLIGSLQTRKVRDAINKVDYFHALDRESLAVEIEKRAEHVINCFVQVNTSGDVWRSGNEICPPYG